MDGLEQDRQLLKALAAHTRLTPSRIATEAGLAATTILRPFNGTATTRLSAPTLEKLRERFPDFPAWAETRVADRKVHFRGLSHESDPDLVELEQIDLRYGLGGTYLDGPVVAEKMPFSRAWIRSVTDAPLEELFWAAGDGDSMEPTIRSGEPMLVHRSPIGPRLGDRIWVVAYGDIGMIKRLRPLPDGTIEVHSDNDRVRPFIAADGELHIIGRVVAVVRRL